MVNANSASFYFNTLPYLFNQSATGLLNLLRSTNNKATTGAVACRVFQMSNQQASLPVQVPFYNQYRYMPNRILIYQATSTDTDLNEYSPSNVVAFAGNFTGPSNVMRSAGDDWQYAFFVGIPTLTWGQTFT